MCDEKLVPKLRFIDKEWSSTKLGKICEITMGQSPSSKNYSEDNNNTILIQGKCRLNKWKSCSTNLHL